MKQPVIRLNITPQSHVRATQGDRILFRIPEEKRHYNSQKRVERLQRYSKYKIDLLTLAKQQKFTIPAQGMQVMFFLPIPKSRRKWAREAMHSKLHQSRPDLDNLCKAFFDALLPEDGHIAHFEASKHWVSFPEGWIEIRIKEPVYPVFSFITKPEYAVA